MIKTGYSAARVEEAEKLSVHSLHFALVDALRNFLGLALPFDLTLVVALRILDGVGRCHRKNRRRNGY
jgi:hypothetical protein